VNSVLFFREPKQPLHSSFLGTARSQVLQISFLVNVQFSISISIKLRKIIWAGLVARIGEGRGVYRVLVGKHEEKRPLEKTKA
jgi:hypothetical protein